MKCYIDSLVGGCGVTVFSDFSNEDHWGEKNMVVDDIDKDEIGAGWGIACFIDEDACREAYNDIASKYNIIFQSPVRTNRNTGNPFFFIIFDLYNELSAQDVSWSL